MRGAQPIIHYHSESQIQIPVLASHITWNQVKEPQVQLEGTRRRQ